MTDLSILLGGKAGDGIDRAGLLIARVLNRLNYRIYIYRDYPSLIRGGHTFSVIRASDRKISAHPDKVDILIALNQETLDLHKGRLKREAIVIYNSDMAKPDGMPGVSVSLGIPMEQMVKASGGIDIMRNSCAIGALFRAIGVSWDILEGTARKNMSKEADLNLKIALNGYGSSKGALKIETLPQGMLPILTGSEAIGLGLVNGGLDTFIAYPMTPASPLLHFLAGIADDFSLKVIHPENEIAVMLMAAGSSYAGERVAVGTSGGGFCLMTEGLSLSGMAELPVVIMVGQRPGPSTGLPTYTAQTELNFVLSAGQGEFPRLVVAPGDAEEAFSWSHIAMKMSMKYQIPSIILADKTLAEGVYSFDPDSIKEMPIEGPPSWDGTGEYGRYRDTASGVSPMVCPPRKDAVVKVNSYEHDEYGITTEDPAMTVKMQDKRLRKGESLSRELEGYETVKVSGKTDSSTILLCWGSNKGVCEETADRLGLKMVRPVVLGPFPVKRFLEAVKGAEKVIAVENNATGQLAGLAGCCGCRVDKLVLKYDGRPFSLDELEARVRDLI
ncbi:MAG: 2-oxoacid:acceptor oxidoreductase subunit alpha [Candidatus Omnitrophota bacterium]